MTLASGNPADLDGFESRTFELSEIQMTDGRFALTIPITDDAVAENSETFVFEIAVDDDTQNDGEPTLRTGDLTQTAVVITDNDNGQAASATLPIRDGDGDGLEDGGFRLISLPIRGVTAGDSLCRTTGR